METRTPTEILQALEAIAMKTLETLAFAETFPQPAPEAPPGDTACLGAAISLGEGAEMALWVETGFLRILAGTLYSLPVEAIDRNMLGDALLEILNIVSGRFLAADPRKDRVRALGLPRELGVGAAWGDYAVRCFLRAEPSGYFSVAFKS